jgi:CDP-glucose 4,6-dehydratase
MNFWKGKKVFVTGADGFIGSWLAKTLIEKDADVVTLVRDIKKENNLDALKIRDKITFIIGDLIDFNVVERLINEYDIEVCFHLAAQAIVGSANKSPLSTFESNIKGTWNLLEACRLNDNVKRIVIASSDKAYGQQEKLPYTEESPLLGYYPYDASKACADILATSYFKTYGLPLAITRNANTYGPADLNFGRIIPDVISSIIKGIQPVIRSDGTPERDYMYIKDAVDAYLALAENIHRKDVVGEAFNFGTETPISVLELYNKIIKLVGKDIKPKILGEAKNEIDRQYLSIKKAKGILKWQPKYIIDQGLKEAIEWYTCYLKK